MSVVIREQIDGTLFVEADDVPVRLTLKWGPTVEIPAHETAVLPIWHPKHYPDYPGIEDYVRRMTVKELKE